LISRLNNFINYDDISMSEESRKIADKIGVYGQDSTINIENININNSPDSENYKPINWPEICQEMLAERQRLTTNPLTMSQGVNLQVQDVYVPLGLVERKKISKRQNDISPERGSEIYQELEVTQKFQNDEFLTQVFQQKNTPKSKGKRIAIIGEPGAGKTTLLQQIADYLSKESNQSIVIWVSLADLQDRKLEKYLEETTLNKVISKRGRQFESQIKDDFEKQFHEGRVWLLLDGLDEMSVNYGNALTDVARQIRESGCINQARIVLTCRLNLWDGSSNALDDFDIYRTLDFSYPEQVEEFIDKWFTAIHESDRGQRLCNALKEPGKERIQDLVKNPLRLTLLCLIWQWREGSLPDTQAGLYQQLVDDIYKWKLDKFPTTAAQRQELNIKLGKLAKEAIDKEATRFRLRGEFVHQFLGENEEGSLLRLALRLGWLNQVGLDIDRKPVYAFFHASFQEYFAATAIDDWDFFLNHVPKNPSLGTYRIFEAHWKQTILLWVGCPNIDKTNKEKFINALVEFKDGCGKWPIENADKGFYAYQAYFLAVICIVELKDYNQTTEDKIVQQIVNWGCDYYHPVAKEARVVLEQTNRKKTINYLLSLLNSSDVDNSNRWLTLLCLEKIGIGNKQVINALEQLLNSKNLDSNIYLPAAKSLSKIEPGHKLGKSGLDELMQSENIHFFTNKHFRNNFLEFNHTHEQEIQNLLQKLQLPELNPQERWDIINTLRLMGTGNLQVVKALLEIIQSSKIDVYSRIDAAKNLGMIDPNNTVAATHLLKFLQSSNVGDYIVHEVIEILAIFGVGNEQVITALVEKLKSTEVNSRTYHNITSVLGKIGKNNKQAIAVLEQQYKSHNTDHVICWDIIYSLSQIDPGNQLAYTFFVQMLQSKNIDYHTREQVANNLVNILQNNLFTQTVIDLKNCLTNSQLFRPCYSVLWHCAQNMSYPEFYQAWHQSTSNTSIISNLAKIAWIPLSLLIWLFL
jgi:HEAT repeat protein/energy-coupling factor transporter ATP-binding protein EcfA2